MPRERLGEILIRAGYLTQEGLQTALNEQQRWGGQLGRYLVELGLITEEILVRALSSQYKVTAVALDPQRIDIKTAKLVPQEICERNNLVCFRADAGKKFIDVAMSDPSNLDAIDEVRVATKQNVRPYIAAPTAIDRAISYVFYGDISLGSELDLSPNSALRLDGGGGGELLKRSRGTDLGPGSTEMPSLDVKVSVSPAPAARPAAPPPSPAPPKARPAVVMEELPPDIELPTPVKDDGFHITMDVPAVDKAELAKHGLESRLERLEATVARNSDVLRALLEALAAKGLFTKDEIKRILG